MTSPANDQSRTASSAPSVSSLSRPSAIAAAPRVIRRVTNCSGRRSDSWLKAIARAGVQAVVLAQRADELVRGELGDRVGRVRAAGVCSFCGLSRASPKIAPEAATNTRAGAVELAHGLEDRRGRAGDRAHRLAGALPRGGHERRRREVVDLVGARRSMAARSVAGSSRSPPTSSTRPRRCSEQPSDGACSSRTSPLTR